MNRYDWIIRGGHVIDPANDRNGVFDIAIAAGKIAAVEEVLEAELAENVYEARGKLVTPGLVDLHMHGYHLATPLGIDVDHYCLGVGREADVTVLALEDVTMELEDCNRQMRSIRQQIIPHAVWRSGEPGEITTPKNLPNVENIASGNRLSDRLVIRDEPL